MREVFYVAMLTCSAAILGQLLLRPVLPVHTQTARVTAAESVPWSPEER